MKYTQMTLADNHMARRFPETRELSTWDGSVAANEIASSSKAVFLSKLAKETCTEGILMGMASHVRHTRNTFC